MTKRQHLLLACLKRCNQFLATYANLLGAVLLSPPARELEGAITMIEFCETTRVIGLPTPLPLAVRQGRAVRKNLDDLVRPVVRESRELSAIWKRARTVEPRSRR